MVLAGALIPSLLILHIFITCSFPCRTASLSNSKNLAPGPGTGPTTFVRAGQLVLSEAVVKASAHEFGWKRSASDKMVG